MDKNRPDDSIALLDGPEGRAEQFRLLVESVRDYAIFLLDPEGRVASWNPGAERIKGYSAGEAIGLHLEVFYPEEDRAKAREALELAARKGRHASEGWRVRKDGSRFWAEAALTALRGPGGELRGFAKVTRDSTERRWTELAMRSQAEDLARSNEELSQFTAAASHDLKAPLRKILAFGDLLRERLSAQLEPDALDLFNRMTSAAATMAALVDDLLELARLGREELAENAVDMGEVLANALEQLEDEIRETGAEIRAGELPPAWADRSQMERLLRNLLANAIKFRKSGEPPRIEVSGRPALRGMVEYTVRDRGIGFDPAKAREILEPFRRLHPRTEYPGSGMGLAICNKIVLRHGGHLRAESRPGEGAAFHFVIPAGRPGGKP